MPNTITYCEDVPVGRGWQRFFYMTVGLLGLLVFAWMIFHRLWGPFRPQGIFVLNGLVWLGWSYFVIMFCMEVHAGFFPDSHLEVTRDTFRLRRGFIRRQIALANMVEICTASSDRVRRKWRSHFPIVTFMNLRGMTHVEIVLTKGKSVFVASAHAEELAEVLRRVSDRARREGILKLIPEDCMEHTMPSTQSEAEGVAKLRHIAREFAGAKKDAYWARATASLLAKLFISSAVR